MNKILAAILLILLFSCKKDNPQSSPYQGTWLGTYTGSTSTGKIDNGNFTIVIAADGTVTGTATSLVFNQTFQVLGNVNSTGNITMTFGAVNSGSTFSGTLKTNNTGSGTWENKISVPPYTGTWTGNKQ